MVVLRGGLTTPPPGDPPPREGQGTERRGIPSDAAAPRAPRPTSPREGRGRSRAACRRGSAHRGHPPPNPQSQSFSRSYGSILPTSLTYILLWTRGYTPWRPDAVMSTPGGDNVEVPGARIFTDRRQRTGHAETPRAFPAFPPPLRVNRFRGLAIFTGVPLLTRKDNSPRDHLRRLRAHLRYRASTSRPRNINRVPFR